MLLLTLALVFQICASQPNATMRTQTENGGISSSSTLTKGENQNLTNNNLSYIARMDTVSSSASPLSTPVDVTLKNGGISSSSMLTTGESHNSTNDNNSSQKATDDITVRSASPFTTPGDATLNNTTLNSRAPEQETATWEKVMNYVQLILAGIGIVANGITFYIIFTGKKHFSDILLFLLKNQSFYDGMVCLGQMVFQVPPFGWKTHVKWLDYFLCHFWHSQGLFWMFVSCSTWNLVLITIERFLAMVKPLVFIRASVKQFALLLILVYFCSLTSAVLPLMFRVRFVNSTCTDQHAFVSEHSERFFIAYPILWYVVNYTIPCLILIVLYTFIINVLIASKKMEKHGSSKTIDNAKTQITKMAICVITVFVIFLGFSNTVYVLGSHGHVEYTYGSPLQVADLLMTMLNSVINPFIYIMMLPAFRQSVLKLFGCGRGRSTKKDEGESTSNSRV